MCKKSFISLGVVIFLMVFGHNYLTGQPNVLWTKAIGGANDDVANYVQKTSDGGFIITGYTYSYGAGAKDVYLLKTDAMGNRVWSKIFGGTGDDEGRSVQQTFEGGYIIAGNTTSFGVGGFDVWLIKTDSWGDIIWTKTYGEAGDQYGNSVYQTMDGGYLISGTKVQPSPLWDDLYVIRTDSKGDAIWIKNWDVNHNSDRGAECIQNTDGDFIITGHSYYTGSGRILDFTLFKIDPLGNLQWVKTYGVRIDQRASSVQQTNDGGYILTGYTAYPGMTNPDILLVRADADGNQLWAKTYGGPDWEDASMVRQSFDGGYAISGRTNSFGAGGYDVWIVKTDANGNTIWTNTYGGPYDENGWALQQTFDGGLIVTGFTNSYGVGGSDVWLIRAASGEQPVISQITDVPNDQGKQVRVTWAKSSFDGVEAGDYTVTNYSLWRRIDTLPNYLSKMVHTPITYNSITEQIHRRYLQMNAKLCNSEWDFIEMIPATGSATYNTVAHTLADSTKKYGVYWTVFVVLAHAATPLIIYSSEPDSGYSIDNLVPKGPKNVIAKFGNSSITLSWEMVPDEDLSCFAIYRSTQSGFDPTTLEPYAMTIDTFFTDAAVELNINYYYRISAFDSSGNESEFSDEINAIITGLKARNSVPKTYELLQNFPNPFNCSTTICYSLPNKQWVNLKIYDLLGQKVATLVDESKEAGTYTFNLETRHLPSGVYFYKLQAGSYSEIKKMILMR